MTLITLSTSTRVTKPSVGVSQSFHEMLLDNLFEGVYFVDVHRRILYWNSGATGLTGFSAGEVVGRRCFDNLLQHVDNAGHQLCYDGCPLAQTIADGRSREAFLSLRHKNGHRVPVCVRVAPIRNPDGDIIGAMEVFNDATAKEHGERRMRELEKLAFLDSLTSLPNRHYGELKIQQALDELREFHRSFGLLLLDVDHFKKVNDTLGHDGGDEALRIVAKTLLARLRQKDTVARWGGEEFMLLLGDANAQLAHEVGERCRILVERSTIPNFAQNVTVSVGCTLLHEADTPKTVMKRADQLLYISKTSGRNLTTVG